MVRRKRSSAKTKKDREQDKKLSKLMSLVDTGKKQADAFYQFRQIYQPGGQTGSTLPVLGVSAVSLLEGITTPEINLSGASVQSGANKKHRTDSKIKLDNINLKIQLKPNTSSESVTQQVCIAVIRSKNYRSYPFGVLPNLLVGGNTNTSQPGPADNLLLAITNSNPTTGLTSAGGASISPSNSGYPMIVGNADPTESFGGQQFLQPCWATETPYHYDVIHFSRHKLTNFTRIDSRFGTVGVKYLNLNLKKKVKGVAVDYAQGVDLVNPAAQINENNIWLCMWSDQTQYPPTADVISRVKFYD